MYRRWKDSKGKDAEYANIIKKQVCNSNAVMLKGTRNNAEFIVQLENFWHTMMSLAIELLK